jgi:predicted molibdopterin-dependent oxidoreductase YjgC
MLIRRRDRQAGLPRTPRRLVDARPEPAFALHVDDQEIEALPGHTIAAALWRAGIVSWRRTRGSAEPRGVFCAIGVCFDCLVTVNGRPNQRACLVLARPGDVVATQAGTGYEGDDA